MGDFGPKKGLGIFLAQIVFLTAACSDTGADAPNASTIKQIDSRLLNLPCARANNMWHRLYSFSVINRSGEVDNNIVEIVYRQANKFGMLNDYMSVNKMDEFYFDDYSDYMIINAIYEISGGRLYITRCGNNKDAKIILDRAKITNKIHKNPSL